jgi:hypothetical protein
MNLPKCVDVYQVRLQILENQYKNDEVGQSDVFMM